MCIVCACDRDTLFLFISCPPLVCSRPSCRCCVWRALRGMGPLEKSQPRQPSQQCSTHGGTDREGGRAREGEREVERYGEREGGREREGEKDGERERKEGGGVGVIGSLLLKETQLLFIQTLPLTHTHTHSHMYTRTVACMKPQKCTHTERHTHTHTHTHTDTDRH